ncbi:alcohol dehydrogenase catalytic domain-containing protein [Nocardiopsis exhalans]|uniref:Alcohol dehydrogenase catalytic domain-containing protein n=1 Tax=Nocardiopsis exhalans TaxID=163604 RepID=A0ABY5D1Q7_9ACTN|nr:alcohol dehydrogenase catalytic domain-containing protein [Nocardiopsis exhalans]USY17365.1 alcohol dehydrogenase catalytic domain-containing protein [Nocardiopsis exhalans]
MRAALMYGAGDVRVENVPDPVLVEPTDALVRVVAACVCGSDLHAYRAMPAAETGVQAGHEFVGVVEEVGREVTWVKPGELVVSPFAYADNTCDLCREGVQASCPNGGLLSAAQAELIRVPQAQGTLVRLPVGEESVFLPSLITLADVYGTGYHAALTAGVNARTTVTVIGDGAVGLLSVLSARRMGAEQIILMGRHKDRTDLGREYGATEVVPERGPEGAERVRELTRGEGAHAVIEAVGHLDAYETALGVVRAGGAVSRVGVPQYDQGPIGFASMFGASITLTGGPAPVRSYIEKLLPAILEGKVNPGLVFDHHTDLDGVPEAYRLMDERKTLKALVRP